MLPPPLVLELYGYERSSYAYFSFIFFSRFHTAENESTLDQCSRKNSVDFFVLFLVFAFIPLPFPFPPTEFSRVISPEHDIFFLLLIFFVLSPQLLHAPFGAFLTFIPVVEKSCTHRFSPFFKTNQTIQWPRRLSSLTTRVI